MATNGQLGEAFDVWCRSRGLTTKKCDTSNPLIRLAFEGGMIASQAVLQSNEAKRYHEAKIKNTDMRDDYIQVLEAALSSPELSPYYVIRNISQKVFVKEGEFFASQGGLTEDWGKGWIKVMARSVEHAREVGEQTLPAWSRGI